LTSGKESRPGVVVFVALPVPVVGLEIPFVVYLGLGGTVIVVFMGAVVVLGGGTGITDKDDGVVGGTGRGFDTVC